MAVKVLIRLSSLCTIYMCICTHFHEKTPGFSWEKKIVLSNYFALNGTKNYSQGHIFIHHCDNNNSGFNMLIY